MPIVTGFIQPIRYSDLRWGSLVRAADGPCDWRPSRMTEEQLLEFVLDVVNRKVFFAEEVSPPEDLYCVFPATTFLLEISKEARLEIGTWYEYRGRATGRSRGGQPSFGTARFIHREDWLRARDLIATEVLRREREGVQ